MVHLRELLPHNVCDRYRLHDFEEDVVEVQMMHGKHGILQISECWDLNMFKNKITFLVKLNFPYY